MPNPRALGDRRRSAHLETNEDLKEMLRYLHEQMEIQGRNDSIDIMYMTFEGGMFGSADFNLQAHLESIAELEELGVNWLAANAVGSSLNEALEQTALYGEAIISACSS